MKRGGFLKRKKRLRAKRRTLEENLAYELVVDIARSRAKGLCERCGREPSLERCDVDPHHVWTRARGGPHEDWNLAMLCRWCHSGVHDHTVDGWQGWLASNEEEARAIRERCDQRL